MEITWIIILISLCIAAFISKLFLSSSTSHHKKKLPPGPTSWPVIGNILLLRKPSSQLEPVLRSLRAKFGPIITLRLGSRPIIFIGSHSVAHQALVQNGTVFSDRPKALAAVQVISSNQNTISSATYGPTWRLLRRHITTEILNTSRIKSFSAARHGILKMLINRLVVESQSSAAVVKVVDHFQYAMFSLMVMMCFGEMLDEKQIKDVERVHRQLLLNINRFNVLNFWPRLGKVVFRKRWKELLQLRQNQEDVLIPIIRSRMELVKSRRQQQSLKMADRMEAALVGYVDTLVDIELPEEKRKLDEKEMVSLSSEFINAGTDSTSTALQWIMANLVKHPHVQSQLYQEITATVGPSPQLGEKNVKEAMVKEDDLQKMPYLKSVVLEGLRRHPPGHFVLPHTVTEDVELEGYLVPKDTMVNFMVAEMAWDPKVWDEPLAFKPERFCGDGRAREGEAATLFDITGSKEFKMMPFGAGRRICPGSGLALLHLEFFVANLIWYFEWTPTEGDTVDLTENQEFTVVMKYPLRAHISPRGPVDPTRHL